MTDYLSTEGLILRAQDYKEADQLLTIYTRERGKIKALAKGVKKNTSKLRGGLVLFGHSRITMAAGKVFPVIINTEGINAFAPIRNDFVRMSYAGYAAELLDGMLADEEQDECIFQLLIDTWQLLASCDAWLAVKILEFYLLEKMGYQLQLKHCLFCNRPLAQENICRGVVGGLVCSSCPSDMDDVPGVRLSVETRAGLQALRSLPWERLPYIYFSQPAHKELDKYLDLQLQQILERPLKTKRFLQQML